MAHTTTGQGVGEVSGQRLPQAPAAAEPLIGHARAASAPAHPVAARDRAARLPRLASLEMTAAQSADLLAMMATLPELPPDSLAPNATADAAPRPSVATEPGAETVRRRVPGRVMPTLLPPTPDTSLTFRPGVAALDRPNATHTGAVEETTEVHVHIGRIEVIAVHEPAPAKPAAARRPAPMSLDDYLAKRHGGRP
jgi:hypothetical protein